MDIGANSWVGPHRIAALLRARARGTVARPSWAQPTPPPGADSVSVKVALFAKGALAVATAAMMLVAGCGNLEPSLGSEPPTPTETPTEMPTATATPALILRLTDVSPDWATAGQVSFTIYIRGENIGGKPYVFLTHPTHGEIEATDVKVYPGGCKARCAFDISGAEPGMWGVQAINLDGAQSELLDALEIVAPTPTATSTPSSTPTATSTPSPTPTATIVIVRATDTPVPPTATPTAKPKKKRPDSPPEIPPPSSQP